MPTYEALVHVVDPKAFIRKAYAKRNDVFRAATVVERAHLDGPITVSSPGGLVSVRSSDRLNVEDVLVVDLGVTAEQAALFIKKR